MATRLLFVGLAYLMTAACHGEEVHRPLVVAHRGLLKHAPENTLANFRACLELRLGFEFDVRRTKDGQLVCIHDSTVDRTTNGKGKVASLTLDQIRRLDAGSWFDRRCAKERVPTVEEVLKLVGEYRDRDILVTVDLKDGDVEAEVVRLGEKYRVLSRLLFIGRTISDASVRKALLEASPKAQVARVAHTPREFRAAVADGSVSWVYLRFLPTHEEIGSAHKAMKRTFIAGIPVSGNVPKNWARAIEAGVDGVLTDYPLELRTLLRERAAK